MAYRLIIDGNTVYEIDEECEQAKGVNKNASRVFSDQRTGDEKCAEKDRYQ